MGEKDASPLDGDLPRHTSPAAPPPPARRSAVPSLVILLGSLLALSYLSGAFDQASFQPGSLTLYGERPVGDTFGLHDVHEFKHKHDKHKHKHGHGKDGKGKKGKGKGGKSHGQCAEHRDFFPSAKVEEVFSSVPSNESVSR